LAREISIDEAKHLFSSARRAQPAALSEAVFPDGFEWPEREAIGLQFRAVSIGSPFIGVALIGKYRVSSCVMESCSIEGLKTRRAAFTKCRFEKTKFGPRLHGFLSRTEVADSLFLDCSLSHMD
jgi:hypothetical protein